MRSANPLRILLRRHRAALALGVSWLLLATAWSYGEPLGSKPDEGAHYVKALAVGAGHLSGKRLTGDQPGSSIAAGRFVRVAAGRGPEPSFFCNVGQPAVPSTCHDRPDPPLRLTSWFAASGSFPPTGYLIGGKFAALAASDRAGLRAGRLATGVVNLALLAAALAMTWRAAVGSVCLLGLLLAIPPITMSLASEIGPNGLELCSAITFCAALLHATRAPDHRTAWLTAAVGGTLLSTVRPGSWAWTCLILGLVCIHVGYERAGALLRAGGGWATASALCVSAALGVAGLWQLTVDRSQIVDLLPRSRPTAELATRHLAEMVGVFGWNEVEVPSIVYYLWQLTVVAVVVVALLCASRRQRRTLVLSAALTAAAIVTMSMQRGQEFGTPGQLFQGRSALPILAGFILITGEIVTSNRACPAPISVWRLGTQVAAAVALVQTVSFLFNAQRHAVGSRGPLLFGHNAMWRPTGGWELWFAVVATAAVLTLFAGIQARDPAVEAGHRDGLPIR